MTDADRPCKLHCWHTFESFTNTAGGSERMQCCRCGEIWRRDWRNVPDPDHGPHVRITKRQYLPDGHVRS